MPCCLAILTYGCGHKQLWKIHCTNECPDDALCSVAEQEILAIIRYRWRCENCHNFDWDTREECRADKAETEELLIIDDPSLTLQQRDLTLTSIRSREDWMDRRAEKSRTEQVEEIQWVVDFAEEYGQAMWRLKYGPEEELRQTRSRLAYLIKVKFWDISIARDVSLDDAVVSRCRSRITVPVHAKTSPTSPDPGPGPPGSERRDEDTQGVEPTSDGDQKGTKNGQVAPGA